MTEEKGIFMILMHFCPKLCTMRRHRLLGGKAKTVAISDHRKFQTKETF